MPAHGAAVIIPAPWREIYRALKETLRTERDRGARERLRRAIAALERGAAAQAPQAVLRTLESGAVEMPAIEMLDMGYLGAPTVALLRWHRFLAGGDEETARCFAMAVLRRERTLPLDPSEYFSAPMYDA